MYTFFITWWQPISQHHHDIALLVDQAFLRLDVHPKDGLLELEELASVFDLRDTDGNNGSKIHCDIRWPIQKLLWSRDQFYLE